MGLGVGMAMANQMAQNMPGMGGGQPAQASPPPLPNQGTTYHVAMGGQQAGPFTIDQMRSGLAAGQMNPESLVWTAGMASWQPANQVPALQSLFAPTPPPLPNDPPPVPPAGA